MLLQRQRRRRWYNSYLPGWFVWGGSSGGGSGTVQTDGVTIQGDGSAGNKIAIKQVETDTSLSGAGTVASKLAVVPLTAWTNRIQGSGAQVVTANQLVLNAITIPAPITFSTISVLIFAADNANNNDIGLYSAAGTLVANIGAQHIAGTAAQTFSTVQGSKTIPQGAYFFAYTSAASNLTLYYAASGLSPYYNATFGASVGGALPAAIVPPAFTVSQREHCLALW